MNDNVCLKSAKTGIGEDTLSVASSTSLKASLNNAWTNIRLLGKKKHLTESQRNRLSEHGKLKILRVLNSGSANEQGYLVKAIRNV